MHGELVFTTSKDHTRLHGFYCQSSERTGTQKHEIDGAILLHGLGGNFYSSRLLKHFGKTLLSLGLDVVFGNTRGHDMVNSTTQGGRTRSLGAAMENVGDAVHDVAAWTDFLEKRGRRNVLVFGHSLGAIKALYSEAHAPHENVKAIIGLSATRLSYSRLIDSPRGALFRETIKRSQELIADGKPDDPIHVMFPLPTWMTPQCYIDKYGPAETYNWMRFIDKVDTPTLLLFGERELDDDPAFEGVRDELNQLQSSWSAPTVIEIPEADHFYSAKFDEVDMTIKKWLSP